MQKAKKYDWKDSNLALFGSDTERKVKKDSAQTERAWKGVGAKPGLRIWRIVKFKVTDWPPEQYGEFYNGDSYIVLHTYKDKDGDELLYDVHFWIGKYSTQDEYGTAAYKTVELDTYLDDKPIQHREVEGHESELFKSYFNALQVMEGGAESGFRRVGPENYKPRLMHFCGERKNISVREVPYKKGSLNSEDVFIVDTGHHLYQFNGKTANKDEKFKAAQFVQQLKSARQGKPKVSVIDESSVSPSHPFFQILPDGASDPGNDKEDATDGQEVVTALLRVSDRSGELKMDKIANKASRADLDSSDVFIINTGRHCFVWIGKEASVDERRNGLTYAHQYLMTTKDPFLPVTVIIEGQKNAQFDKEVC